MAYQHLESQMMANSKRHVLWLVLFLLLSACSKTPKEQAMAGFYDGCNVANLPEVKKYCDCMGKELDAAIPSKVFNNPDADQGQLMSAFAATLKEFGPKCKKE